MIVDVNRANFFQNMPKSAEIFLTVTVQLNQLS